MKAGLVFSDVLTTVSPNYAIEIQTPEYGAGLEGVLQEREHKLRGIINGLDYSHWDPRHDEYLAAPYGPDAPDGKAQCKRDLLQHVGLPGDVSTPVIGIVSRLSSQKGVDLIASALESLLAAGCYLILLGAGDEYYMRLFEGLGRRFRRRAVFRLGQRDEALAHKIYAGSDLFLMPSRYEPCGLGQMISLAYGTIPIVRATGGLADTVQPFNTNTGSGNGFVFREYNTTAMLAAMKSAVQCYHSKAWPQLVQNAFAADFSWSTSAAKYAQLYREVVDGS